MDVYVNKILYLIITITINNKKHSPHILMSTEDRKKRVNK